MIRLHMRIHVGVEAKRRWVGNVPRGSGLTLAEPYSDNRLGALESILPWHHNSERRPILIGQHLSIHSKAEQCQRMHGFIHAQTFHIRPLEHIPRLAWHLLGVEYGREFHKFRFAQWLC